ncbi:ATP-dependent DNA helicase PIF1-like [Copidosoma floridanum]|uniref:ATP-dependent DNA helicase PIF1-like n=1 Tax=Copidosoma floridanum TaxID=29053 RepID=UPI0006C96818|nr:ATP-dependent DNA helicase PIF1-like [Copidosoma floridanum]
MDEHPEFDIVEITRKIGIDILNNVEITSQEAAWNEDNDILADSKYINLYEDNEAIILEKRLQFESNLDINKTIDICRQLCRDNDGDNDIENVANLHNEISDAFQCIYNNPHSEVNADIHSSPLQIFFTGPAGCGKTFVIKLLMKIYNRFTNNDGFCNAYITYASTGKAAEAIDGTTVHTALKITLTKLLPLSMELVQLYRTLFKYVRILIIDEVSMVSAELLQKIDCRLKQITGNFNEPFGGLDIILIGDLRQLPLVRATSIYKSVKQQIAGPSLWRGIQFYELTEVMRQSNQMFSSLLTKIGNGEVLDENECTLIESRFYTKEEADRLCPNGIPTDEFIGYHTAEQLTIVTQKFHKMSVIDTGGLPYQITFVLGKPYMITSNINVSDGLANGAVGSLNYVEYNDNQQVTRVWLLFHDSPKTGEKIRKKSQITLKN